MSSEGPELPTRIVLVGFMAAGKSSVGRRVADRLGYRFVDLDDEIERMAGRPVAEIFERGGEERFRELEERATRGLDPGEGTVVAVGGGWMSRPALRDAWPGAVRVWLAVDAATAVARLGDELPSRPLLDGPDPVAVARRLLEERRPDYERAEIRVDTRGRVVDAVAEEVVRRLAPGTP